MTADSSETIDMSDNQPCADALQRIYPYLDGEVTTWRRWWVRRHLRHCPPCEDLYDFEDRLKAMVREKCSEEVPDEVVDRLRQFLRTNDCDC